MTTCFGHLTIFSSLDQL